MRSSLDKGGVGKRLGDDRHKAAALVSSDTGTKHMCLPSWGCAPRPGATRRTCRLQIKACWVVGSARAAAASGLPSGTGCRPNTSSARASTCTGGQGAGSRCTRVHGGPACRRSAGLCSVQGGSLGVNSFPLPRPPPSCLRAEHARVVQVAKLALYVATAHQLTLRCIKLVSNGGQVQLAAARAAAGWWSGKAELLPEGAKAEKQIEPRALVQRNTSTHQSKRKEARTRSRQ